MYRVRQQDLPFQGSSHHFVGADNGDVNVEVRFEGRPRALDHRQKDSKAGAGDILVIKAGEVHSFRCIGDGPLVQVDVHLSPRFVQENLTSTP